MKSVLSWLGLDTPQTPEHAPLRELVDALDRFEPDRARHLARFAYLLGRVAHADRRVSAEETRDMEALVVEEGGISSDQAMLVVSLAKSSNLLFGGTADFLVAQEFAEAATYAENSRSPVASSRWRRATRPSRCRRRRRSTGLPISFVFFLRT